MPTIQQNGTGGTTVTTNGLITGTLTLANLASNGAFNLGTGLTHTISTTLNLNTNGNLNFGSSTLAFGGATANFSSLTTLTTGTGTLRFTAASGTQVFTPKASTTHPNITHTGAGTLQLATNGLSCLSFNNSAGILDFNGQNITTVSAGNFTVTNGTTTTFTGLAGRTITVDGNASLTGQSGNLLNLNPASAWTLTATASSSVAGTYATIANGTVNPSSITGSTTNSTDGGGNTRWAFLNTRTWDGGGGDYNWTNATNWSDNTVPNSLSQVVFNGTSTKKCVLDAAATVYSIQFTSAYTSTDANTGKFDFSTNTLTVETGAADFTMGTDATIVAGTGNLTFSAASGSQTFTPRSGATYPAVTKAGAGTVVVATNALTAGALAVNGGTWNWGSSTLTHAVSSLTTSGSPTLVFGTNTMQVTSGSADFSGLGTLTANTGTVAFTAASGTQILTPKASTTHPHVTHTGAGTLQLATNSLSCLSFNQSAGVLDFNGRDITTTGTGNFTISNGTTSSISNLGGRTITVGGIATLDGQNGNYLNLNPGTAWTLEATASSTVTGTYVTVANGTVNPSTITGTATNATNGGGNTRWTFINNITWDGGGTDGTCGGGVGDGNKWSCAANWSGDAVPTSTDLVTFNGTSTKNAKLDANVSMSTITFTSAYTGTFDFQSYTLTVTGNADFRSGGAFTPGTGKIAFTGTSAQIFRPPGEAASTTLPAIEQNGAGGATVTTNRLRTSALLLTNGTFNLGAGLTDTVTTTLTCNANGGLHFGSSTLVLEGSAADFSALGTLTAGTGTLSFTAASGTQTLTPKSGATFPAISKANAGTVAVAGNGLTSGGALTVAGGTWNWGSSTLTHSVTAFSFSNSPTMTFGTNTVQITSGNAALSGLGTLNTNTGTLSFTASSGTQVFTPKAATGHPHISHSGAGTLQLATNDLSCLSFSQSGGTLDFNGRNVTTTGSGNFTVTNGASTTFSNLGGRTLTVAGNASFNGTTSSTLGIDPGSTWTVNATGSLSAGYARVGNSNAAGSTSAGQASNSENIGGNTNWTFLLNEFTSWNHSTKIAFNTTSSGANVAGNVANFPLLVRLDSNNFNFNQAKPDGSDIRFADPDGSILSYVIERWSQPGRRAEVWVKVPQVDGNSALDYIKMYWGNNSATTTASSSGVWGTYAGVYYLTENPGAASPQFTDASGNGNNATAQSGAAADSGMAQVGRGWRLNGSSKYLTTTTSFFDIDVLTHGCWFRTTSTSGGFLQGWQSTQTGGGGQHDRKLYLGNDGKVNFGIYNGGHQIITSASAYNDGGWHHAVGRIDGSGLALYVDGVLAASSGATNPEATTGYWRAGWGEMSGWTNDPTNDYFNGTLDQTFFIHSALSADHIKLFYETQKRNGTAVSFPNTALSTFAYSTKVHINTTASGAATTSDVANFPLLVRLTSANFNFAQAKSDGGDLRFADSAGNLLAYDLESFDAAAKTADIWVLVPTVKGNNNAQWFRMYWGKGTATSLSSSTSVFGSANSFVGVWHLNEDGSTTAGAYKDASSYANDGTGTALTSSSDVAALIGKGQTLDGATTWINAGGAATGSNLHPTTAVTMEAWVKATAKSANDKLIVKASSDGATPWHEYTLQMDGGGSFWESCIATPGGLSCATGTTNFATGTWQHVAATYDGTNIRIYLNGILEKSAACTGTINDYGQALYLGTYQFASAQTFNGVMDETRLSRTARSADWVRLSYETQKAGSAVVQVGNRTSEYAASVRLNFNTTATGANVSGNVANIPILVRLTSATIDFSKTNSTGSDIQFVDKSGAYLYHNVTEWDKGNRVGKVWVKVPQVDGNSTTDYITLYYGCAACTGTPWAVADSVWGAYRGVWHMNVTNENLARDGTARGNHMHYMQEVPFSTGLTAPLAPSFASNGAKVADPASGDLDMGTGDFTLMGWIKTTMAPGVGNWPVIFGKTNPSVSPRYGIGIVMNEGGANSGKFFFEIFSNGTQKSTPFSTSTINDGNWHFIVGRRSAGTIESYRDGVSMGTTASAGLDVNNPEPFQVGGVGDDNPSNMWTGSVNTVSLAATAFSADYIKLSYMNQKESDALISGTLTPTTSHFQLSKVYKFNTTSSGANIAGDVHNFPLLIRITGSTMCDAVQSGAPDIRFLDADGNTWLDYEIERWDQTLDSAEVWVKVPMVDGNSSGDFITMWYKQAAGVTVPDGQCGTCVFSTTDKYQGVWHLNNSILDATSNANNGTNTGSTNSDGVMGAGRNFDGVNDYIQFGNANSLKLISDRITVEAWVRTATGVGASNISAIRYDGKFTALRYTTDGTNAQTEFYNPGSSIKTFTFDGIFDNNAWHHFVAQYDHQQGTRIWRNGSLYASELTDLGPLSTANTENFTIGATAAGAEDWTGRLDEVRVSSDYRDSNYIKLSYQTQRRDAAPLFNASAADFVSTRVYRFNTTRTGANVMGDVESIPLLVRITGSAIVDAVQNDYDDIRFLDGDGKTWLQYQVERWDKTGDVADVWVLVPKVDGNSDNDFITLYYDDVTNGAVPNGECATCVFSTTNGFAGAWHLHNSTYTDATANANNGTNSGSTSGAGISGDGRTLSGNNQWVNFGTGASLHPTGNLTMEVWAYATAKGVNDKILNKAFTSNASPWIEYNLDMDGSADKYRFEITTGGVQGAVSTTTSPATGAWYHLAGVYNGSTMAIYLNGVQEATAAKTGTLNDYGKALMLGTYEYNGNDAFTGTLDEPRIHTTARSADWLRLSYQNQRPSGNLFWNSRAGPNNKAVLTATANTRSITLSWPAAVTDSANADSVGIWLKYSGPPDSVGAAGQTKVVTLPKSDTTYSYPALYPATYYFALAVRNASGQWSPFTAASTDTAVLSLAFVMNDTIYVDSAIGNDANSCTAARNPTTPKLTLESADGCDGNATDTLVIRMMPGTYAGAGNDMPDATSKPIVVTSFDDNSRAILNSSGSGTYDGATRNWTVFLWGGVYLRNLDVKCAVNGNSGIYVTSEDNIGIQGVRIYNDGSLKHAIGIENRGGFNYFHVMNSLVHEATSRGILTVSDNSYLIAHNVLVGTGAADSRGIDVETAAWAADATITNNILYNWDYGIETVSANIGVCSSNLFHLVTNNREVTGTSDAAKITRDPGFWSTMPRDPHAYKLLPGSPAIDAGSATYATGAEASSYRASFDRFGTARPQGAAPDIGLYEGSGHTPNPTASFDTLTNTVSGNTVIVKNSKWKLVWDMARGGGITGFYDMTGDTTANLVGSGSLLFDARLDAYVASAQTGNTIVPTFVERTRARSVVRQRLAVSGSLDLAITYSVHASGHVWVRSEIANLSTSTLDVDVVQYGLKLGSASTAALSGSNLSGISYRSGYGWLAAATKDAFLAATKDLDGNGYFTETWSQAGSVAGALDSVGFSTSDLADLAAKMKRHHYFLLYLGDNALDAGKAAALNADAYSPSVAGATAGSLLHERSWQDRLGGHWPLDDGAGAVAKDRSINFSNNGSLTSATWVSGKAGGALRFTTASMVTVADADPLEAAAFRTYMLWVKPDFSAMGADAFVLSKGLTTSNGWHFRRVSGASRIKFVAGSVELQSPILTSGAWAHLAAYVDGNGVALYVNGVLAATSSAAATLTANSDAMLIGKSGGDANAFAGDIDDVRIYHVFPGVSQLQAIVERGFSAQSGQYHMRADNNNRLVALLNESGAQTRIQPAFRIDNWYGPKSPKYVYLNGTRLTPNIDFVSDSVWNGSNTWDFGFSLMLQVNRVLTGTNQVLFVDDNDSSGYMGEASRMKGLSMSATANDKFVIKNFSDTVFGSAASGQWYLELDLNGWTSNTATRVTDTGFGEFNSWKSAAISPNIALASATQLAPKHSEAGRTLCGMKFDNTSAVASMYSSGSGYAGPANIAYTLVDSSATRLSLTLSAMTIAGEGNITMTKRWTVYPTGRIFGSFLLSASDLSLDAGVRVHFQGRYNSGVTTAWTDATAAASARQGLMGGNLDFHSLAGAVLSLKSAGATSTAAADVMSSSATFSDNASGADLFHTRLNLVTTKFESTDDPITVNFAMDISRDFTDSATADSLMRDLQSPAAITAITGTAATNDALDFNADGFAEGDGAYTYTASGAGVAHFRFVNTVAHFNPAFRIKSWAFATLPEFVAVDNQTLTLGYHYNAYVNTATDELILQLNRTLLPATHVIFLSHKTGLAVSLNRFEAVGGDGLDSLFWTTESEFENLGFNLYRRVAGFGMPDSLAVEGMVAGAGVANALRSSLQTKAAAKKAADSAGGVPRLHLSAEELAAGGWVRLNSRLIPGAKGGSSATTLDYVFLDRTAAFGVAYEYLLEAVDFSGGRELYGPRMAQPVNPLETALAPNYPNPFNPVTTLRFSLRERARVSLVIYDSRGRVVRTLVRPDRPLAAGKYRLIWDARDDRGFEVPSGQYYYRFSAPRYVKTRKMLLVK